LHFSGAEITVYATEKPEVVMTRAIRFFCAAAAAALLITATTFTAFAVPVKIDGIAGNLEWQGAEGLELAGSKTESNCGVEYAYIKWMTDEKNAAVTLAVLVTADGYESGNELVAALFVPQPGSQVAVTAAGVQSCDDSLYSVQCAFEGMSGESFAWEVRIGFKFGLPSAGAMGIRLRDAQGSLSNYYEIPAFTQTAGTTTAEKTTAHKTQTTKARTSAPATQKERASTNKPGTARTTVPQKPAGNTSLPGTVAVTSAGAAAASQAQTSLENAAPVAGKQASRRYRATIAVAALLIAAAAGISVWAGFTGRKNPGDQPGPEPGGGEGPPDDGPPET